MVSGCGRNWAACPTLPISDLRYMGTEPVTGMVVDKLIVGTFGRGAWSLAGAAAKLAPTPVLTITGDDGPNASG